MPQYYEKFDNDPFQENDGDHPPHKRLSIFFVFVVFLGGITILLSLFFWFQGQNFYNRFQEAFLTNQQQVLRISKNSFMPHFHKLILLFQEDPEGPEVMKQMDIVINISHQIRKLFEISKQNFPYESFSDEEQKKIYTFFDILTEIDSGRHEHVYEVKKCIVKTAIGEEDAKQFCQNEEVAWKQEVTSLVNQLVESLDLNTQDEEEFRKAFTQSMQ